MKETYPKTFFGLILILGIYSFVQIGDIADSITQEDITNVQDSTRVLHDTEYKPDVMLLNRMVNGAKRIYNIAVKF